MNKNLYIGNLSDSVTEEDLRANFAQVGKVISVRIMKHKFTRMSKGFGFVEMETDQGAEEAIKKFDAWVLLGKKVTVKEAKPKKA